MQGGREGGSSFVRSKLPQSTAAAASAAVRVRVRILNDFLEKEKGEREERMNRKRVGFIILVTASY